MTTSDELITMIRKNHEDGYKCYVYSRCVTGEMKSIHTSGHYIHISHVKFTMDGLDDMIMNVNTSIDPYTFPFQIDVSSDMLKVISKLAPTLRFGPMPLMKFKAFPGSLKLDSVKVFSNKYTTEDSNELMKMRYYFDLWMKGQNQ